MIRKNIFRNSARKMLREGEIDKSEASLAALDQVDRIQDFISDVSKMSNDELPSVIDSIRASFSQEQAESYQSTASSVFNDLLNTLKDKKSELENALLVLTGDSTQQEAPKTELNLPGESEEGKEPESSEFEPEKRNKVNKPIPPLGREQRIPTEEARIYNKKLTEAKIVALKKALDKINEKKFPVKAHRLYEELKYIVTKAIKEEAQIKKGVTKKCPKCKSYVKAFKQDNGSYKLCVHDGDGGIRCVGSKEIVKENSAHYNSDTKEWSAHKFEPSKRFPKNCKVCQQAKSKYWHKKEK